MTEITLTELAECTDRTTPLVLLGRLWNGLDAQATEDGAVRIENGRITFAGERAALAAPANALTVRTGGTLMPGLIDLHVHARPGYLAWFVAAGVTTVRDACNSLETVAQMRALALKPRLLPCGPLLDGPDAFFHNFGPGAVHRPGDGLERRAGAWVVDTPQEARDAVTRLHGEGITQLKLYEQLAPEVYEAAARRARELDLPVMTDLGMLSTRGLTGARVDARQALALGVRTIEHVSGYALAYQRMGGDPLAERLDGTLLDDLAGLTVEAGTALVPTLMIFATLARDEVFDTSGVPLADLDDAVQASLQAQWQRVHAGTAPARHHARADLRLASELLTRVRALGGRIGAGTDTPAAAFNLPGGGLHQELELLAQAGLSPLDALRAATSEAGQILGRPDLGVLREGAVADVLVVRGNPLRDLRATRQIAAVVQGGRVHTPEALREALLRQGAEMELARSS
ncbi:amidohydrolase family protein [Deinococcus sp. NW-56]|uniref:amidohydrolase family protein n=1 Tax=Deinococcus sp. NW-56 TaxID=2080419 RepID=UPI000CF41055|nr:amidohydrolase family protein [Deinococcus sp. NW-56]